MTRNEVLVNKESGPRFEAGKVPEYQDDSCVVNYGLVLQLELEDIPGLLRYIASLPNSRVFYQTKSVGRLNIVRG